MWAWVCAPRADAHRENPIPLALRPPALRSCGSQICTLAAITQRAAGANVFFLTGLHRVTIRKVQLEDHFFYTCATPLQDGIALARRCCFRHCWLHPGVKYPCCAYGTSRALSWLPRSDVWTLAAQLQREMGSYTLWTALPNKQPLAREQPVMCVCGCVLALCVNRVV